ncbi:hypothetical protein SAMN05216436_12084 [bacterium A37T11]|nr:hypothetical protein SAMN05216436_12084 [bacterium A37T11]
MDNELQKDGEYDFYSKEPWDFRLGMVLGLSLQMAATGRPLPHFIIDTFSRGAYIRDFIFCSLLVWFTLLFIRKISLFLDEFLNWQKEPVKRALAQYIIGYFLPLFAMEYVNSLYVLEGGNNLLHVAVSVVQVSASCFVVGVYNVYCFGAAALEMLLNVNKRYNELLAANAHDEAEPVPATVSGPEITTASEEEGYQQTDETSTVHRYEPAADGDIVIPAGMEGQLLLNQLKPVLVLIKNGINVLYVKQPLRQKPRSSEPDFSIKVYHDSVHKFSTLADHLLNKDEYYQSNRIIIVHKSIVIGLEASAKDPTPIILNIVIDEDVTVSGRRKTGFLTWLSGKKPLARKNPKIPFLQLF